MRRSKGRGRGKLSVSSIGGWGRVQSVGEGEKGGLTRARKGPKLENWRYAHLEREGELAGGGGGGGEGFEKNAKPWKVTKGEKL